MNRPLAYPGSKNGMISRSAAHLLQHSKRIGIFLYGPWTLWRVGHSTHSISRKGLGERLSNELFVRAFLGITAFQ
jgi:hypothetical protein